MHICKKKNGVTFLSVIIFFICQKLFPANMVQFINRKVFKMSNDSHSTYFKQRMEELTKANEQKRLAQLQQRYKTTPDYTNMSLRDELKTRLELQEMDELQKKYGQQQTSLTTPKPAYWETASEGQKVLENVLSSENTNENNFSNTNIGDYIKSAMIGGRNIVNDYFDVNPLKLTDKYKHAYINCHAAQNGKGGADIAKFLSSAKEFYDVTFGNNTQDASDADNYANRIGRVLGTKYPKGNCNELVGKYIKKQW